MTTNHAPPLIFYQVAAQLLAVLLIALFVQFRAFAPTSGEKSKERYYGAWSAVAGICNLLSIMLGEVAALSALVNGSTWLRFFIVKCGLAVTFSVITIEGGLLVILGTMRPERLAITVGLGAATIAIAVAVFVALLVL